MLTLGLPLMQFGFGLPDAFHLGFRVESLRFPSLPSGTSLFGPSPTRPVSSEFDWLRLTPLSRISISSTVALNQAATRRWINTCATAEGPDFSRGRTFRRPRHCRTLKAVSVYEKMEALKKVLLMAWEQIQRLPQHLASGFMTYITGAWRKEWRSFHIMNCGICSTSPF